MNKNDGVNFDFGRYYKHLIDHVPGAMIVFGIDEGMLHVRYISDNCVKISGFTPEETYRRALRSPIADAHPDDRHMFLNQDWEKSRDDLTYTYRILCKDGNYKWVRLSLSRADENDEILYYGLFSDVDAEYKKQERLREQEQAVALQRRSLQDMYQSIMDETKAMITMIDAETYQVVYANRIAEKAANISGGYIGCTCYKGIHHSDSPCPGCLLLKPETTQAEVKDIVFGTRTYRMLKKVVLWNGRNTLLEYSEDITEQKQLQEAHIALETERRSRETHYEFLSRMSHDMRTPMNGILGLSYLMEEQQDAAAIKSYIPQLRDAGEYLLQLINDVLDVNKISSGSLALRPHPCEEKRLFDSTVELITPMAEKKNIAFYFEKSNVDWSYVLLDERRVKQIFVNLLGNAIKFTPAGGRVDFIVEHTGEKDGRICRRFTVRDSGIGIRADFLPHIYEPFRQEERGENDLSCGTGLGLSIVKQLIEMMGGSIDVESKPDQGSKFTVSLSFPLCERPAGGQAPAVTGAGQAALQGKRILLCEDHSLNAKIAKQLLERRGCEITWAQNGRSGLDLFCASAIHQFDAILMDIRMPVMDGLTAAEAIRRTGRADASTIPIIAMTANAYDEDIRHSIKAGMNAHLSKPVQPEVLYGVLCEYLSGARKETDQ